jgi:pantetheine-phosphate adenylyltransferase
MPASLNSRHAVYAGSFDPVTLGHVDVVRRGARLFERLVVGIGINPDKQPLFTPDERVALMQEIFSDLPNVEVICFEGLTVEFVRQQHAAVMLRGVRTVSDIELEFTMTLTNRALEPGIETVFLMASDRFSHISSTLIKQIAQMGGEEGDRLLKDFVPEPVIAPLLAKNATQ